GNGDRHLGFLRLSPFPGLFPGLYTGRFPGLYTGCFPGSQRDEGMPADGQDPQGRKREQPHQRPTRRPDRLVDPVSEHGGDQAHDEGADAEELLARLAVHVMRRSAYTGTTPKRSTRAANATSSPRSASASWRAASEPSSASSHPANSSIRAMEARAASLRASLRMPLRMALMRRPAV